MGTHPIFESDFDCLTEGMNRILTLFYLISIIDAVLPPKVVLQKRETVPEYADYYYDDQQSLPPGLDNALHQAEREISKTIINVLHKFALRIQDSLRFGS